MFMIVGLGNPGLRYRKTPHNAGFIAIDALAKKLGVRFSKKQCQGQIAQVNIGGKKGLLVKPQTYMNRSGDCVRELAAYYKIQPADIIVIYDDKDLDLGKLRIRQKGSPGSHNGMKSITQSLQTEMFPRVRFGIGAPPQGIQLMTHVLHKLTKIEYAKYLQMAQMAADAAEEIVLYGIESAQQKYSSKK